VIEEEPDSIQVFEFNNRENKFKEIGRKIPPHAHLDSNKILLIIDLNQNRIWHWRGSDTTPNMQSIAKKSVIESIKDSYILKIFPNFEKYGTREKFIFINTIIRVIDEGNEPSEFKVLVGLMEKPNVPEFKINNLITLKLEYNKTFIYIKGKKFMQCMRLCLHIPPQKSNLYEEIESIDEATEIFNRFLYMNKIVKGEFADPVENQDSVITPEQEFWGHCSNLQTWVENKYDTRLLHSNLSFPLLKRLSDEGDKFALIRFKEEIASRLEGGYLPVIHYLLEQNYIRYLSPDDLIDLQKKCTDSLIPQIFNALKGPNRDPTESQRSLKEYSKLRRFKALLYVPDIIDQMNPKEFVIGLSSLEFTFLDFFLSPAIENKEMYFETLLERLLNGLKSKDFLLNKATKHFIERIVRYLHRYIRLSVEIIISHKHIDADVHKSNAISIIWLLEKLYENKWENLIIPTITLEDVVSFRFLLENRDFFKSDDRIVSAEGLPQTIIVALSYFDTRIGPSIFYAFPQSQLEPEILERIYDVMDQPSKEEFLTQSFENVKLLNYYFQIDSDWARGNKEMLMISVILKQQIPIEVEKKISILCKEFSEQLQSNKEIFKAFYINEFNHFNEEDQKNIIKNESLISAWVVNLYRALIEIF